jgi:hypothetical protein
MRKTILILLITAIMALGCGPKTGTGERNYTVRAQVVQPPEAGTDLYLYHEAIDDWMGRDGKIEGMDTMAMPFPVAEGVSLEGIRANDKVEVKVRVNWDSDRPVEVTEIRKLPPNTTIEFRAAKPPKNL